MDSKMHNLGYTVASVISLHCCHTRWARVQLKHIYSAVFHQLEEKRRRIRIRRNNTALVLKVYANIETNKEITLNQSSTWYIFVEYPEAWRYWARPLRKETLAQKTKQIKQLPLWESVLYFHPWLKSSLCSLGWHSTLTEGSKHY